MCSRKVYRGNDTINSFQTRSSAQETIFRAFTVGITTVHRDKAPRTQSAKHK